MRKLVYYVATTIDGFIAALDDEFDFFPIEGPHMAHILEHLPETLPGHARSALGIDAANARFDTVVMGRGTYEPALAIDVTDPYPHLRTVVFTSTIDPRIDANVEITRCDPLDRVRELKQEDGQDIWICGGGKLAGALLPEIDELVLKQYPIVAGDGRRLFSAPFAPHMFRLLGHQVFDNGVVFSTLERAF